MMTKEPEEERSAADRALVIELVKMAPNLLWFALVLGLAIFSYKPLMTRLESGEISKMSFASVQIEFVKTQIEKSARASESGEAYVVPPNFSAYLDRIQASADRLSGARALWVNDRSPVAQFEERRALAALGIQFDLAKTNDEAMQLLELADHAGAPYDFVISDVAKEGDPPIDGALCFPWSTRSPFAGCELVRIVRLRYPSGAPPLIFYAKHGDSHGTPPGVFGATDRFDELVSLVLDALDRRTPPSAQKAAQ